MPNLPENTLLIPQTGGIINARPGVVSGGQFLELEGFDLNKILTDKSEGQRVLDLEQKAIKAGINVRRISPNDIGDFFSQALRTSALSGPSAPGTGAGSKAQAAAAAARGSLSIANLLAGNFGQAGPAIDPKRSDADLARDQAGREILRQRGINPDQFNQPAGETSVPAQPVQATQTATDGITSALGSNFTPTEAFTKETFPTIKFPDGTSRQFPSFAAAGILGAVRVTDSNDPNKVFLIGPGGFPIDTPEQFKELFGTLEQGGIVGTVDTQQAKDLGIQFRLASNGQEELGTTTSSPIVSSSEDARAEDDKRQAAEDEAVRAAEQERLDRIAAALESGSGDTATGTTTPPAAGASGGAAATLPDAPTPPDLSSLREQLRGDRGVEGLQSELNDLNADIDRLHADFASNAGVERSRLTSKGIMTSRLTKLKREFDDEFNILNNAKQARTRELNTALNIIEQTMQDTQTDFSNAMAAYNTEFDNTLANIKLNDDQQDDIRSRAVANLSILTNAISASGQGLTGANASLLNQIMQLELQAGLPPGTMETFFSTVPNAKSVKFSSKGVGADGNEVISVFYEDERGNIDVQKFDTGVPPVDNDTKATINNLAQTYPDAGISSTDTLVEAQAKVTASASFNLAQQNTRSLIGDRADKSTSVDEINAPTLLGSTDAEAVEASREDPSDAFRQRVQAQFEQFPPDQRLAITGGLTTNAPDSFVKQMHDAFKEAAFFRHKTLKKQTSTTDKAKTDTEKLAETLGIEG